jgi:hypothetical protein
VSCECYKIGGRFIAEDPDCPVHGTEAQKDNDRLKVNSREVDIAIDMLKLKIKPDNPAYDAFYDLVESIRRLQEEL